ncbi:MAG: CBS domain-containing protein [Deltaproteobacteria bacterium]|nr:CBS domain-containing protein [Deltaproteobacteria bacterium]MBW2444697.1 CBS domain-containing protein [Deltaproteobacteria bacterium]
MTTIREVMTSEPITVRPDHSVQVALELLIEHRISGLPVVDGDGVAVGIVSEKDLLRLFSDPTAPNVGAIMTRTPIAIDVDGSLVELFDCLMAHDFRRVLIEERGRLVGLVSRSDLMPAILSALQGRSG